MQQPLQEYLMKKFQDWQPRAPGVMERTNRSVTLKWLDEEPFEFMRNHLLYKVQRKEKIPPWTIVYSGGKTLTTIDNLAPSHPHKFRLQVILKSTAVSLLAEEAIRHYGDENTVNNYMKNIGRCCDDEITSKEDCVVIPKQSSEAIVNKSDRTLPETLGIPNGELKTFLGAQELPEQLVLEDKETYVEKETNDSATSCLITLNNKKGRCRSVSSAHVWLQSQWSEETWTSTDTDGTSAMCFCMGVRCGYFKQVQVMVTERAALIGAINSITGLTPLATAVKKGDLNAVKFVLSLGAEVDQATTARQTSLHLAVLAGHTTIADVLLEKGANFQAQDLNGLRVEHYAVDSCKLEMVKYIMDKGGDVGVKDNNGWTPLFRAVIQGAITEVIEELIYRGSSVDVTDRRGLTLIAAARLLKNRQYGTGRSRDSVLRLVDAQFPHEKALANFTRLTKKIYNVHTLLK